MEIRGNHGIEATVYLLLFTLAASRTLYFSIESYGLYLSLKDAEEKKRAAELAASRPGPRETMLMSVAKVVPDIRVN